MAFSSVEILCGLEHFHMELCMFLENHSLLWVPSAFRFTVTCIKFLYFHVCLSSPLDWLQASLFVFAPVSVQCWGIIRLEILLHD